MAADEHMPSPLPARTDVAERLGKALIFSAVLHALILGWPTRHAPAGRLPAEIRPAALLATLARPSLPPKRPAPPPPAADVPVSVGPKVGATATPLNARARFATPPDFSALEAIPLAAPLRLHMRVQVTPQGRAGRIEVVESLRVPADVLAAVSETLAAARFLPGTAGAEPAESALDLVIEASPSDDTGGAAVITNPRRQGPRTRPDPWAGGN